MPKGRSLPKKFDEFIEAGPPLPISAGTSTYSATVVESEARELVKLFIRGFHERWQSVRKAFGTSCTDAGALAKWSDLIRELDKQYMSPGARSGGDKHYHYPAKHGVETGTQLVSSLTTSCVPVSFSVSFSREVLGDGWYEKPSDFPDIIPEEIAAEDDS
jgi:hypothetical protein